MRPCVRGIMGMTKSDLGNDRFGDFQKVFLRAFSYFSRRQRGCRVREEDMA